VCSLLFGGGGGDDGDDDDDDDDDGDDEEFVVSMSYSGKDANHSPIAAEEICVPAFLGKTLQKV